MLPHGDGVLPDEPHAANSREELLPIRENLRTTHPRHASGFLGVTAY